MLIAENKHELSKTISLAEKDVKESNVIKVTRNKLKPCNNNEIKLYTARLDYLAEKNKKNSSNRRNDYSFFHGLQQLNFQLHLLHLLCLA
jgi:hypothetical protein